MEDKKHKTHQIITIYIAIFMSISAILPSLFVEADDIKVNGFEKGVSWAPIQALKKTTFVEFDNNSLLDDYTYLAAIPTSVFYDEQYQTIYSHPLLYLMDPIDTSEERVQSLDGREGIDYFMEDWMGYCGDTLDELMLLNVNKNKLDTSWNAKNVVSIQEENIFEMTKKIALHDWAYSENAVIAVMKPEYTIPDNQTSGSLTGTIEPKNGIQTEHFEVPQTNSVYPIYNEFYVPEGYKFMQIRSWYPCFYIEAGLPGFEGLINMSIPPGDRDLQVYCERDGDWMMAGITSEWNSQGGMDIDKTSVYVYNSGKWSVAITDVPTKSYDVLSPLIEQGEQPKATDLEMQKHRSFLMFHFGRYGSILDVIKNLREVNYQVDVEMYPGTEIEIPEAPPFGCRNVSIELNWNDPSVDLGFSLIGPAGEEVLSTREPGVSTKCASSVFDEEIPLPPGTETDLHVNAIGEVLPGESYKICVFAMSDLRNPLDFTIEYSWDQNFSKEEGAGLASATQASILASELNAPLLYVQPDSIPSETLDALYTMGVEHIHLVDLDGYLQNTKRQELLNGFTIDAHYTSYKDVYDSIREISGSNDIIFSTIDPWTSWYVAELAPAKELCGARSIGPAAFIAAQHGSPVLLIDVHPELSSALSWHTEFWRRHPDGYSRLPTVSEMYLSGTRIMEFLKDYDFDKEGTESIITIAGQFDIGLPWDRVLAGKGKPGRFFGSPVDLSVWIMKNVFYPMIVFENPALKSPSGVSVINGSSSTRAFPWRGKLGLRVTKPSEEERLEYPVLDTLVCYNIKFNSRASNYWGFTYQCADGTIPGESPSFNDIDEGVMIDVNGQQGSFFPDMSGAEVQPFYLKQGGYSPVFSTNFDANMYNLNQGVLLWMVNTHGAPLNGGMFMFWDVGGDNPVGYPTIPLAGYNKEENPWRGYEWLLGSTEEPDTMTIDIHGILPSIFGNPDPNGVRVAKTALDWALAYRPIRDVIGTIASLPLIRIIAPDWLENTQDYYDGVIITVLLGRFGTSWYNGSQVDESLGNIHSAGVSSVACLPAGKYLHLTLMRHGSPFQIMDPWATSWYSDVWQNNVPRGIALGETVGEIYAEGITKVGIQYVSDDSPQWWWDLAENVCLYGDPDLRVWVPSTEFSDKNNWDVTDVVALQYVENEGFEVDGHHPFGATAYPHERDPPTILGQYLLVIVSLVIIVALLITAMFINRKSK